MTNQWSRPGHAIEALVIDIDNGLWNDANNISDLISPCENATRRVNDVFLQNGFCAQIPGVGYEVLNKEMIRLRKTAALTVLFEDL